ncbi:DUF4260 domain-containing protein [Zunongwangia sp. H14]|uniref:DUF4260 domain-containing protein n=1 Tax=Zunongwangia sp. H14 TaxID=3240792 RepID=UPI003563BDED
MKIILQLEELAMLMLGMYAFSYLGFSWWWFIALFFAPDVGMIGYAFGNKTGAVLYNVFHHKGLAIMLWILGYAWQEQLLQLIGLILFSHSAFDRILGYGLKYQKGFKFTHLGEIGK